MRKGQQFKIQSIEELKEAYEKLSPWSYTLDAEVKYFNDFEEYRWIEYCKDTERVYLMKYNEEYEVIPNPFKKEKPEPISTAMNNINEAIRLAKTLVEVAEMAKERNELREDLNALRKEVDKMKDESKSICIVWDGKEEKVFINNEEKEKELLKEKQQALDRAWELVNELFNKDKFFLELKPKVDYIDLIIKYGRDIVSIPLDKSHVERLVDYLKKHFEI